MAPPLMWHIFQIFVDYLFPIVIAYVLNQSRGHWLFNDVLHFAISLNLKLKEDNQVLFSFESLMEDEYILVNEFVLLVFNIRKDVCGVLDFFLSSQGNVMHSKVGAYNYHCHHTHNT
jgi:hypothetical protein